jgi:tRNA (cmo5U34)-methyltransferase
VTLNGFDRIAFIYDFLARIVFGQSIVDSQRYFLNKIQNGSKILILGGGTGWLLADLMKLKPDCKVWYIEASEKMIALARNKVGSSHSIHFIHGTEESIPEIKFEVVITNFYLDLFSNRQLEHLVKNLQSVLKTSSSWIVTDFVNDKKWWQPVILRIMYFFFRITCGLKIKQLPEWDQLIARKGTKEVESKSFYRGFIKTVLYQC